MFSSKEALEVWGTRSPIKIENSEKLLGIHVNNNLNFDYHVNQLCKKGSTRIHALTEITKGMVVNKKLLYPQFSFCPPIWICHNGNIHDHSHDFVGNKAKGRISKRVFQENKARQIFLKTNIFYPLTRTRTCAYQGVKNVRF